MADNPRVMVHLSPREKQVMQMIADGLTVEFIAYQLGITSGVVRLYTSQVRHKLDAQCTTAAVAKCVQLGIIHVNVWAFLDSSENSDLII